MGDSFDFAIAFLVIAAAVWAADRFIPKDWGRAFGGFALLLILLVTVLQILGLA